MPFLRARMLPHKDTDNATTTKKAVKPVYNAEIYEAVKLWLQADDLSTRAELTLLGLD